jgi:ubiquinone/menaquinone biosynthesis C-methylase UbiE
VSSSLRRAFLNRYIQSLNIGYSKLLAAYIFISIGNLFLLYIFVNYLHWAAIACIAGLTLIAAAINFVVIGLWAFVSLPNDEVLYEDLEAEFFDDMVNEKKVGKFRAWAHRSRFELTRELVIKAYRPGMAIVDFACGSCNWNDKNLPVVGLDVNKDLLKYGFERGRLKEFHVASMYETPFRDHYADIAVSSQVFEHLNQPEKALQEIRRVLKPDGVLVIDVPWDFIGGIYFFLFNIHCFIKGYIQGEELYKRRCGHLNHFSKSSLRKLLETQGFRVEKMNSPNGLTLHVTARKK